MLVSAGLVSVADRFDDATIQIWEPVVRSNGFIRHADGDMSEAFLLCAIWICGKLSIWLFPTIRIPLDRLVR
jgi:hypothetical protein